MFTSNTSKNHTSVDPCQDRLVLGMKLGLGSGFGLGFGLRLGWG